jgi:alpha-galactosidase
VWSCSSFRTAWPAIWLGSALSLAACGREDIELSRRRDVATAGAPANDDCSAALPPGLLAARPPLGWNPFNAFDALECDPELDEARVLANVDALVSSGMQAAGYQYVIIDKCFQVPARSADGRRVFDPVRLPSGIEALSDYVHQRGLQLGTFSTTQDCLGTPGSDGHEAVDAESYAAWGLDYVKHVKCPEMPTDEGMFRRLATALGAVSRPIALSIASPPFAEWMRDTGQLWRTGDNAEPTWEWLVRAIDRTVPLAAYARPGGFNDPDMLEIGNPGLTESEQRVQFSVWSILAAPLLAGNDLSVMTEATRSILTNGEVLALNQDPLALQAALVRRSGPVDVLAKPLAGCGARAVVLWNRDTAPSRITLSWSDLWLAAGAATVRDLWAHAELAPEPDSITLEVPGHDALALKVVGVEPPLPRGEVALSDVPVTYAVNGHGPFERDTSNGEDLAGDGVPQRLRGAAYDKGIGAHPPSLLRYRLGQACSRFIADVGIDDETEGQGTIEAEVWADGERLFESGRMTGSSPPKRVDVDVTGKRDLRLFLGVGGDDFVFDHTDWAGARLICQP